MWCISREGGNSLLAYVKGVNPYLIQDRPTTIWSPEHRWCIIILSVDTLLKPVLGAVYYVHLSIAQLHAWLWGVYMLSMYRLCIPQDPVSSVRTHGTASMPRVHLDCA